jgi:hypothetical protein
MELWSVMFVGEPFANLEGGVNEASEDWMFMNDDAWTAELKRATSNNSLGGSWITMEEYEELNRPVERAGYDAVPVDLVHDAIMRWNETAGYIAYGVAPTLIDARLWAKGHDTLAAAATAAHLKSLSEIADDVDTSLHSANLQTKELNRKTSGGAVDGPTTTLMIAIFVAAAIGW